MPQLNIPKDCHFDDAKREWRRFKRRYYGEYLDNRFIRRQTVIVVMLCIYALSAGPAWS